DIPVGSRLCAGGCGQINAVRLVRNLAAPSLLGCLSPAMAEEPAVDHLQQQATQLSAICDIAHTLRWLCLQGLFPKTDEIFGHSIVLIVVCAGQKAVQLPHSFEQLLAQPGEQALEGSTITGLGLTQQRCGLQLVHWPTPERRSTLSAWA